ncbi:DUF4397 domain-containing protein [Pontibacter anaerobius]|uniref:DUF4397 domain-containing protein n=1 Tax=Pontibacter anaerobius TaxID=2993940 RepID=A0ABT3RAC2_9BACT|nr:DUF4397 domain-containing protein [Pontibacter anaerobius]MCX2738466.1 DUF4397 domain-containing protein [Pontibacter anaerobius]
MKYWMKMTLLAVLPTLFLASCDDDDDDVDLMVDQANVMVVHASPDAPGVDLYVDDTKVNNAALNYPENTGYLEVEAGERNFKVTAAGAGLGSPVIDADVTLEKDMNYTVFAADELSNITPIVLVDDLTAPASGQAHVRFVHLSPDAPNVDIVVQGGPDLFTDVEFTEATAFTPVAAGTYTVEAQPVGTDVAAVTATLDLQPGKIYTVFAKGFLSPPADNTNTLGAEVIVNN